MGNSCDFYDGSCWNSETPGARNRHRDDGRFPLACILLAHIGSITPKIAHTVRRMHDGHKKATG